MKTKEKDILDIATDEPQLRVTSLNQHGEEGALDDLIKGLFETNQQESLQDESLADKSFADKSLPDKSLKDKPAKTSLKSGKDPSSLIGLALKDVSTEMETGLGKQSTLQTFQSQEGIKTEKKVQLSGRKLTKKEKLAMQISSQKEQTILEIISNPKSGEPVKSQRDQRKRDKKSQAKREDAEEKASSICLDEESKLDSELGATKEEVKDSSIINKTGLQFVNGKIVTTGPTNNMQKNMDEFQKRQDFIDSGDHKLSALSFRQRDSCQRWTKDDTELFYKGLRIFNMQFDMISIFIFDGQRTHAQIRVSKHRHSIVHLAQFQLAQFYVA